MTGQMLHPALLAAGGLLAAAPIILHLIMRQKPRRLEFPALRFILARKDANRRKLRLRHLLLLALRVLAVLGIGAALSRPRIKTSGGLADREAPVAAAIVVDTSPRMDYLHENSSRLELVKNACRLLLPRLPKESLVAVVEGTRTEPVLQGEMGAIKERIERLATSPVARPLWESVEAAARMLAKSDLERREMYVFTDLASAAWNVEPPGRFEQALAEVENLGVYVIDVGVESPRNFSIGDVRLDAEVMSGASPWNLQVDVSATGIDGERAVEAYLLDADGTPQKKSQQTVKLAAGETAGVDFAMSDLPLGAHQGYIQILGADGLACDDRRFFTIEFRRPRRLLVAAPSPADARAFDFVQILADDESVRMGYNRFACEVTSYDALRRKVLDESYAAVCLLDPPKSMADSLWQSIVDYVTAGGGVAIALGPDADVESLNHSPANQLLPGELKSIARELTGKLLPETDRFEHPLLASFKLLKGEAIWTGLYVSRFWRFNNLAKGSATVVPLSDRQPLLVERPVGKGRVLTFATPLSEPIDLEDDDRWNRFQIGFDRWPYHMLINETLLYLTGAADARLNIVAGQVAVLRLDPEKKFATYLVSRRGGESSRLPPDATQKTITLPNTEIPGNYRVLARDGEASVELGLSVNLPAEATRLDRISPGELDLPFGSVPHELVRGDNEIERSVQAGRVGVELFPLLMIVLVLVLAGEHVVSNRFYRERKSP